MRALFNSKIVFVSFENELRVLIKWHDLVLKILIDTFDWFESFIKFLIPLWCWVHFFLVNFICLRICHNTLRGELACCKIGIDKDYVCKCWLYKLWVKFRSWWGWKNHLRLCSCLIIFWLWHFLFRHVTVDELFKVNSAFFCLREIRHNVSGRR